MHTARLANCLFLLSSLTNLSQSDLQSLAKNKDSFRSLYSPALTDLLNYGVPCMAISIYARGESREEVGLGDKGSRRELCKLSCVKLPLTCPTLGSVTRDRSYATNCWLSRLSFLFFFMDNFKRSNRAEGKVKATLHHMTLDTQIRRYRLITRWWRMVGMQADMMTRSESARRELQCMTKHTHSDPTEPPLMHTQAHTGIYICLHRHDPPFV